jgi:hypothetical protein
LKYNKYRFGFPSAGLGFPSVWLGNPSGGFGNPSGPLGNPSGGAAANGDPIRRLAEHHFSST